MSTQKQTQATALNELRDEHKRLVLERERLEEDVWNLRNKVKQVEPYPKNEK
jgi:hypothetical protein